MAVGDGHLRLSDAERETAAAELGEHYAHGRITTEEHRERLDRIWAAKTRSEIGPIFADLPSQLSTVGRPVAAATAYGADRAAAAWRSSRRTVRRFPVPVQVLVLIALAVVVLTHLPLILLAVLAWVFLVRRAPWCRTARVHRARW